MKKRGFAYTYPSDQASTGIISYDGFIPYTSTFQNGAQEGIVANYMYKHFQGTFTGAAIRKVLLGATGR